MLSVVPPHTRQPSGSPVCCTTADVMGATGAPGATTARGSRQAKGCSGRKYAQPWFAGCGAVKPAHHITNKRGSGLACAPHSCSPWPHLVTQPVGVALCRRVIPQLERVVVVCDPPLAVQQPCTRLGDRQLRPNACHCCLWRRWAAGSGWVGWQSRALSEQQVASECRPVGQPHLRSSRPGARCRAPRPPPPAPAATPAAHPSPAPCRAWRWRWWRCDPAAPSAWL